MLKNFCLMGGPFPQSAFAKNLFSQKLFFQALQILRIFFTDKDVDPKNVFLGFLVFEILQSVWNFETRRQR